MARILVIDDNTQLRKLLYSFFTDEGYDVMEASNGRIALDMQRDTPADLIITDIFMPEMEGTEFIMDVGDEFPHVKVIAMSGGGSVEGVDFLTLAQNLGAQKIFQKPLILRDLLSAVKELLN